jgi:vacuolar protein sorting-associated protein 13A/C
MFEGHVLYLLRKYLGEYVEGLSVEALRISVWKGDVVLKDLKLKAEALNSLRLPVTVKAGFVGTITLKVPWKSLGKEPVIVLIDRLFVLAHPAPDGQTLKEEDREKLFEAKLQQIEQVITFDPDIRLRRFKVLRVRGGTLYAPVPSK